jgi:hypothetical protein
MHGHATRHEAPLGGRPLVNYILTIHRERPDLTVTRRDRPGRTDALLEAETINWRHRVKAPGREP